MTDLLLQEAHIKANEVNYFKNVCKGQIFHAPSKTKGVMIGIGTQLNFKELTTEVDKES